jgi:hypothetical protein
MQQYKHMFCIFHQPLDKDKNIWKKHGLLREMIMNVWYPVIL